MESHGHISLHAKQICSNCFMFPVLEQVLVVLDLGLNKDASDGNDVDAAAASTPGLPTSFFFFSLLIVSQKPDNNSRCDDAYRRLFFYYRLAHGPVYTRDTDDRMVEPLCSMFLQGSLSFSIHHLPNLMHHPHVCLCYKSNIFPRFDSQINSFLSSFINI